tara:strand:- start:1585 stop:1971 length:387 start_codon:yes stop_codon:yes gene_type:complete
MFQRKPRRFRRRSNGRNHMSHGNGTSQMRMRPKSFVNDQSRNSFRTSLSAEKLFEKYSSLAKEAMTSGDKTLSENYLQHADHFMRIIEDKNRNRIQNKTEMVDKSVHNEKTSADINNANLSEENKNKK